MRVRLATGLGLLLVLGSLVIILSKTEQRLAATNAMVRVSVNDKPIPGGERRCQPESIPSRATYLRVFTGAPAGRAGPLDVSIRQGPRRVSAGTIDRVRDQVPATTRLSPPIEDEIAPAEVCFFNRGRRIVRLAGDRTPARFSGTNPYGLVFADEARIDYIRPGEESGWALAGIVADRFGRAKTSFFGSWTMWTVFALVGASSAAAIVLVLRKLPPQ
jgi:hypothetical protein